MSVHSAGYSLIHLHIHLELGSNLRIFGLRDRQAQHQIQVEVRGAGLQLSVGTDGVDVCAALQICTYVYTGLSMAASSSCKAVSRSSRRLFRLSSIFMVYTVREPVRETSMESIMGSIMLFIWPLICSISW